MINSDVNQEKQPDKTLASRPSRVQKLGWSLHHKMVAVNGSVLMIVLLGFAFGLKISSNIEQRAREIEAEAIEDIATVNGLQQSLLEMIVHKDILLDVELDSSSFSRLGFSEEVKRLTSSYENFETSWDQLQTSEEFDLAKSEEDEVQGATDAEAEIAEAIIETHRSAILDYTLVFETFISRVNAKSLSAQEIQTEVKNLNNSEFISELDIFLGKLIELSEATAEEFEEAQETLAESAERRAQIMTASLLLSGIVGIVFTLILSRVLMRPLSKMTSIAQESIQFEKFDLAVPVETQDEVGQLAQTFNAYMEFVKNLLDRQTSTNQKLSETLTELKRTQVQIVQSAKMSSLGQMVAGIAHEINNPVTFIHSNLEHVNEYAQDLLDLAELYEEHYPNPEPDITLKQDEVDLEFIREDLPKTLASMQIGSDRIREIVLSLRNFSRIDEADLKGVNLHEGLDNTILILNHRLKAQPDRPKIQIVRKYGEIPKVECYAGLLNQVFMNILSNAIDALENNANHANSANNAKTPDTSHQIVLRTATIQKLSGSDWVELSIADNGSGVPADIQERIFEPFFTTKDVGKGTGMGMSISYQIVTERHGGTLEYATSPDGGAEFIIRIPTRPSGTVVAQRAELEPAPDSASTPISEGKTPLSSGVS